MLISSKFSEFFVLFLDLVGEVMLSFVVLVCYLEFLLERLLSKVSSTTPTFR